MSSVVKTQSVNTKVFPDVQFCGGPYYTRTTDPQKRLFPFSFKNGTLEIELINDFNLLSGVPPQGFSIEGGLVRRMGGLNLVQSIGKNFKTYVENCEWVTLIDSDPVSYYASNVKVYKPGFVTRVQQLSLRNLPSQINPANSYVSSSNAPTSDFETNTTLYGSTYAFEKPLVLVVDATTTETEDPADTFLGKQYITFYSSWDF